MRYGEGARVAAPTAAPSACGIIRRASVPEGLCRMSSPGER